VGEHCLWKNEVEVRAMRWLGGLSREEGWGEGNSRVDVVDRWAAIGAGLRRRLAGKGDAEVRVEMAGKDDRWDEAGRWEQRSTICQGWSLVGRDEKMRWRVR